MKSKYLMLFCIFQVFQRENSLSTKEHAVLDDIVYPRIYHMSRSERDIPYAENEKLAIINTPKTIFYLELLPNLDLNYKNLQDFNFQNYSKDFDPCLFQGRILTHKGGMAAISTCQGEGTLHGMLMLPEETLFIEPLFSYQSNQNISENDKALVPHFLSRDKKNIGKFCGTNDSVSDLSASRRNMVKNKISKKYVKRSFQQTKRPTIEAVVFADDSLKQYYYGKSLNTFDVILSILNQVQLVFKYGSLKIPFDFVVVNLSILTYRMNFSKRIDGDKYLKMFCNWQKKTKKSSKIKWDIAIHLTGFDMYRKLKNKEKDILGLAYIGNMCTDDSCILAEALEFNAGLILAHEIGHSLSMQHDGKENSCNPEKYIMSPSVGGGKTTWSDCSNKYLKDFLRTENSYCLLKTHKRTESILRTDERFPGEKYPPDVQCQLSKGKGYYAYYGKPSNNICNLLWCTNKKRRISKSHPALDGSKCGHKKICYEGNCIEKGSFRP